MKARTLLLAIPAAGLLGCPPDYLDLGADYQGITTGSATTPTTGTSTGTTGSVCTPGAAQECYTGPENTRNVGVCKPGIETCNAGGTGFGACEGEVTPSVENCALSAPGDEDCDGSALVCTGDVLWGFSVGDAFQQRSRSVAMDAAEAVIVAGEFIGALDFGGALPTLNSDGGVNIFCAKLDKNGTPLWAGRFGDGGTLFIETRAAVSPDGGVLLAGHFSGTVDFGIGPPLTSAGATDAFVVKLDGAGAPLWAQRFGSQGSEKVSGVAVDASGNVIFAGHFNGTVDFGTGSPLTSAGPSDIFVAKLDPSGAPLWARSSGDAQGSTAVAVDNGGNVVLAGYFNGTVNFGGGGPALASAGATDIFVVRMDKSGAPLWARRFGDDQQQGSTGVALDTSGAVLMTGYLKGAVDFGSGPPLTSAGGADVFLAKLDGSGAVLWAQRFGDQQDQGSTGVAVDSDGRVVLAGYFDGTIDFGSGPSLTSMGASNVFIAKLDGNGAVLWARGFGDSSYQEAIGVAMSADSTVTLAGNFDGSIELGGGKALQAAGNLDVFALRLGPRVAELALGVESDSDPALHFDGRRQAATSKSG